MKKEERDLIIGVLLIISTLTIICFLDNKKPKSKNNQIKTELKIIINDDLSDIDQIIIEAKESKESNIRSRFIGD